MTVETLALGALGTNCYIVSDGAVAAVIDPADNAPVIERHLADKHLRLGAILLTHAHFDHMGAVAALLKAHDVPLYCHREEAPALSDGRLNLSARFGRPLPPVENAMLLEDGDTVSVGELCFTFLHTPGHTVGSGCYRLSDILFSGDTLFSESIGRTDFPGGDLTAMRASLTRLLALKGVLRVLPGHGEETTLAHEQRYNPYIVR